MISALPVYLNRVVSYDLCCLGVGILNTVLEKLPVYSSDTLVLKRLCTDYSLQTNDTSAILAAYSQRCNYLPKSQVLQVALPKKKGINSKLYHTGEIRDTLAAVRPGRSSGLPFPSSGLEAYYMKHFFLLLRCKFKFHGCIDVLACREDRQQRNGMFHGS